MESPLGRVGISFFSSCYHLVYNRISYNNNFYPCIVNQFHLSLRWQQKEQTDQVSAQLIVVSPVGELEDTVGASVAITVVTRQGQGVEHSSGLFIAISLACQKLCEIICFSTFNVSTQQDQTECVKLISKVVTVLGWVGPSTSEICVTRTMLCLISIC